MPSFKVALVLADERDVLFKYELPNPYFGTAPSALLEGLKQCPEVEVHIVTCVRRPVRVPDRIAENVFYHAVLVSRWAYLRTAYLPCIFKIRKKLRQIRPDVVHGQGTERYQGLAAAHSGFPNIITIHGNMRQIAKALRPKLLSFYRLTALLEPLAIRPAGGVVCLSRYTQQQVKDLARRTWVVPNAVAETFFRIDRARAEQPTILCSANVALHKNQNLLIHALDPIAAKTGIRLVFLGRTAETDPYSSEFLSLVKARSWCTHEGFQAGEQLKTFLRTRHMLVLPTAEDNCPMVVLEAMAAGLPVVASNIGGIPDLIDHGVQGLLVDPHDVETIRGAVLTLLGDPIAAEAMAARAKLRALERYRPLEVARRHIAIYQEMRNP
jgi:glycosyltransferase involved in cell wall biosynthesis